MSWTSKFDRSGPCLRYEVEQSLIKSKHAVQFWKKKGFIPVQVVTKKKDCQGCTTDLTELWYDTDMLGHSIRLPLDYDAVRNLQAASDIDPARVVEILRASANREEGLFAEIGEILPVDKVKELSLCKKCRPKQSLWAWVEEICQLLDIARSMEERMLADKRIYDHRWRILKLRPANLITLGFSDIPWPVQGHPSFNNKITLPSQITKSAVRRFLFSRCIYEKSAFMDGRHPRDLLSEYRKRWDRKWFNRYLPWYCRALPSKVAERAAILEGVSRLGRIFNELEHDNWEVILGDSPSLAQWELSPRFPLRERWSALERYDPEKWARERQEVGKIDYRNVVFFATVGLLNGLLSS